MEKEKRGISVAAFVGVRERVGATTIAAQVAAQLAEQVQVKILCLGTDALAQNLAHTFGLHTPRSVLDLVPSWLESGQVSAEILRNFAVAYSDQVDVLCVRDQFSAQDRERLHSYRGREFGEELFNAADACGYDVLIVDAGTMPLSILREVFFRRADWLFCVGGTPNQDLWTVADLLNRLPTEVCAGKRYAILRGKNSLWNPARDALTQNHLRSIFVPWIEPATTVEDWRAEPSFKRAIRSILNEFPISGGLLDWLPFARN